MTQENIKLVNLTPHSININTINGIVTIHPYKIHNLPRVIINRTNHSTIDNIAIFTNSTNNIVENIPPIIPGTIYIVSALVRINLPTRKDIFSPGNLIRDAKGNVIGCDGLDSNL